jgi:seryl-tRNA synthetase
MIDLKLYRADKQKYIDGANNKRVSVDRDAVDRLDDAIRALKLECDELAARRNQLSAEVQQLQKSGADFSAQVTEVKTIKETMTAKESELADLQTQFDRIVATIPNPAFPEVIVGKDDSENQVA